MKNTFDEYEVALLKLAAHADELVAAETEESNDGPRLWADSFVREVMHVLTDSDDEILKGAFSGALNDNEFNEDDLNADALREGIIERILDDISCDLDQWGWFIAYDDNRLPHAAKYEEEK